MDSTNNQPAAQAAGAPQPDAPAPEQSTPEQSAPTKSAAEITLEGQLKDAQTKSDTYKKERDKVKGELTKVSGERDGLRLENGQLKTDNERLTQELADAKHPAPATTAAASQPTTEAPTQEPSQEEEVKALLKRMGLKKAWVDPNGQLAFDEGHLRHTYGEEVLASLTVYSAE